MGCLLTRQPNATLPDFMATLTSEPLLASTPFQHISQAFTLLSTLSEMCVSTPPPRDNGTLGPDPNFTSELIDTVIFALLTVAGPESDAILHHSTDPATFQQALDRAEIVPAALRALALITSAQAPGTKGMNASTSTLASMRSRAHVLYNWKAVCEALFAHPRGVVLIDATFECTTLLVKAVRQALVTPSIDGPSVYSIAYAAGAAIEIVTSMIGCPLFYHAMALHDPTGAPPLRLILTCLSLHDDPLAAPPFVRIRSGAGQRSVLSATREGHSTAKGQGAAELLAARGFALISLLGEYSNPTYLDDVMAHRETQMTAEQLIGKSAAYLGQVLLRPPISQFPVAPAEGQMSINVMRAAELLSDDSNFRAALITGLAPTLAQLLAHTNTAQFSSFWCLGEESVALMGGDSDLLINSTSKKSLSLVEKYAVASKEYHARGLGAAGTAPLLEDFNAESLRMGRHLSLERTILLAKLLVNLHYYHESLSADLEDSFLNALLASIQEKHRGNIVACLAAVEQAAVNMEALFSVAWNFGQPEPMKGVVLMEDVDMQHSHELMDKMNARIESMRREVATSVAMSSAVASMEHSHPATSPTAIAVPLVVAIHHQQQQQQPQPRPMGQPMPTSPMLIIARPASNRLGPAQHPQPQQQPQPQPQPQPREQRDRVVSGQVVTSYAVYQPQGPVAPGRWPNGQGPPPP